MFDDYVPTTVVQMDALGTVGWVLSTASVVVAKPDGPRSAE